MRLASLISLCLSSCAIAAASHDRRPMQLRLAYAGPDGMMVSWNTASKLDQPTVRWGVSPHHLNRKATSQVSVTYPTSTTYNNHVRIEGLDADQLYYYKLDFSDDNALYSFRTSRRAGNRDPFKVAVVVDLGTMGKDGLTTHVGTGAANPLKPGERNTIQSVNDAKSDFDFLWHSMQI